MKHVKVYDDTKLFWEEVSPYLMKDQAKNCLILGLSHTFINNSKDCLFQCAIFDDQDFIAATVVSQYRTNFNLLISETTDQNAVNLIFQEMNKSNVKITGVVGEKTTASLFGQIFQNAGYSLKTNMNQGVYRCTRVIMPTHSSDIIFRNAELKDVDQIALWIEKFQSEAVPHDPPFHALELARFKIENKMIYVLEKDSTLVSMVGWSRDINTSCAVNYVYTPISQRNNGYASLVTAKLTQLLFDQGKSETNLFTDISNPTSNKIYMNIGYDFVCHSVHLGVHRESH